MNEQRFFGRPADIAGRLAKEIAVYDFLDSLGVEYYRAEHEPAATIEACMVVEKNLGAPICKNLMLCNAQHTLFVMVVMPGGKPFKTRLLSPQLGCARLSFLPPELMEGLTGCTPGSASILGLMFDKNNNVLLAIDKDVLGMERAGFHPCINTSTLSISIQDLTQKILPATGHVPVYVCLDDI